MFSNEFRLGLAGWPRLYQNRLVVDKENFVYAATNCS